MKTLSTNGWDVETLKAGYAGYAVGRKALECPTLRVPPVVPLPFRRRFLSEAGFDGGGVFFFFFGGGVVPSLFSGRILHWKSVWGPKRW